MSYRFDDSDDPLEDDEYPDEEFDKEDSSELITCPACGAEIYEDAVACPVCGEYLTHSHRIWSGRSLWWLALGVGGILAFIWLAIVGG